MKPAVSILFAALCSAAPAETEKPLAATADASARRAVTDEELLALRAASRGKAPQLQPLPPRAGGFGLREMSTFIEHRDRFVILPRGSILWCPEAHASRIVSRPASRYIPWTEFASDNRNWIAAHEVTEAQVAGKAPIPEETLARFRKEGLLVIATLRGAPVTVLPCEPSTESSNPPPR